jgi:hypothetical protein
MWGELSWEKPCRLNFELKVQNLTYKVSRISIKYQKCKQKNTYCG